MNDVLVIVQILAHIDYIHALLFQLYLGFSGSAHTILGSYWSEVLGKNQMLGKLIVNYLSYLKNSVMEFVRINMILYRLSEDFASSILSFSVN